MDRKDIIRRSFNPAMQLIEIGPSYNPIIPRAAGWQTTIIDHASQAELVTKYTAMGVTTTDHIEPVDYVWRDGSLTDLIPPDRHGQFDGLVASHVGEHMPDLIGFLQDAARLLKPDGVLALALPDKHLCFDFLQPITLAGDVLEAHMEGRTRHARRSFFNQAAYRAHRGDTIGWARQNTDSLVLPNPLEMAQAAIERADPRPEAPYEDNHAWTFTPSSFELLVLDLNLLGHIRWTIQAIQPAEGVEFYVWLTPGVLTMTAQAIAARRLELAHAMMREQAEAFHSLPGAQAAPTVAAATPLTPPPQAGLAVLSAPPSIVAIIPLYNGAAYIEQTLRSVLDQSLPASEIIVVDDGSTDGGAGAAVVQRMQQDTPLIRLLYQANGGQSSARNLAVRESKSDLLAFLDQDDAWYETHLHELVQPFLQPAKPPLGWVYSDLDEIDEDNNLVCRAFLDFEKKGGEHPKRTIFKCIGDDMFVLPSASLIARHAFVAVGGFDERLCGYEDDDLFLRLFRANYQNVFIAKPLSQWRIYPGSTSYSYRMAASRNVYMDKLITTFGNDEKRARFYVRDLIVPRFVGILLLEYERALKSGDEKHIEFTWQRYCMALRHNPAFAHAYFPRLLQHYKDALQNDDLLLINASWRAVHEAASHIDTLSRRVRRTIDLMRNPAVSRTMFRVRRAMRPAMLWAFRN